MRQPKIIILNCPKQTGKDTIADLFNNRLNFNKMEFKDHLFFLALSVSGISREDWFTRYNTPDKENPWDRLGGLSQREFLIKISEEWIKPVFGKYHFGQKAADKIGEILKNPSTSDYFIFSDGGFKEELEPIVNRYGAENILILQWTRNFVSWGNDSRTWLKQEDTPAKIIRIDDNDTSIEDHYHRVKKYVMEFIE